MSLLSRPARSSRRLLLSQTILTCTLYLASSYSLANTSTDRIAWIQADGPSLMTRQLLQAIKRSDEHGFNPAHYGRDELARKLAALPPTDTSAPGTEALGSAQAADLQRDLDRAFRQLLTDLDRGLVDPVTSQYRVFTTPASHDIGHLYRQVSSGRLTVREAIAEVTPRHEHYARLRAALRRLLDEREVRSAGRADGDNPTRSEAALPDSPHANDADTSVTLTLDETIAAVVRSLERWRWMPGDLGERYLLVNLPNYRLEFYNSTQRIIDMPVVIGKASRGTPVFSRDMQYIDFNPTWTVPARITENELLPLERRSPGYLAARGFELLRKVPGGLERVPDSEMNPQTFRQKPLPYLLRQKPGPHNALGRLKFMLPNPYAIYLHDTPARHLFSRPRRAFSHGCIRLEDPDRLASLLLQIDGVSLERVAEMQARSGTTRINLRTPVPTHLGYFTTWVDDAGQLQHRPDVYGLDSTLDAALLKSESVLNQLRDDTNT